MSVPPAAPISNVDRPAPRVHAPVWRRPRQWWRWLSGLVGSRYDGLDNFHVVRPGVLLRSGQPRVRDLRAIQQQHGLRTIVVARGGTRHPLRGRWFRLETRFCREHGIQLEHWPFSDAASPPAQIFDRFVALMREPANHPVLVHCEQGWHRTGVLVAAYRIALEGWTLHDALDEAARLGFEMSVPKRAALREALTHWSGARAQAKPGSGEPTVRSMVQ